MGAQVTAEQSWPGYCRFSEKGAMKLVLGMTMATIGIKGQC